ncbi:hypothetical protein L4C54_21380 [Vibrio lamellibrachiae]|uniref:hypothetical protein n=1 Tax=Vibrio lamellibrachiae TaxID=2910253 RepID=UPI003D0A152C
MDSYKELTKILDSTGFREFYTERIQQSVNKVDYGVRKGVKEFQSVKSAAQQYTYESSGKYMVSIDCQLDAPELTVENELILQCIEVFDWGGVQSSNIINAINLHRDNVLQKRLLEWKRWFEDDTTLAITLDNVTWSSGWTKVFSFMFNLTTIYDSRVAAYINYIFADFHDSLESEECKLILKSITKYLVSFKGTGTRARCLNREYRDSLGIKMKSANDENNFKANKTASWFLRYLCEMEYGELNQKHFRQIDKAMFMLGFDIGQIDSNAPFE